MSRPIDADGTCRYFHWKTGLELRRGRPHRPDMKPGQPHSRDMQPARRGCRGNFAPVQKSVLSHYQSALHLHDAVESVLIETRQGRSDLQNNDYGALDRGWLTVSAAGTAGD